MRLIDVKSLSSGRLQWANAHQVSSIGRLCSVSMADIVVPVLTPAGVIQQLNN